MSSACVLPLDIHAMVRDSSTPIGTATTASLNAARISYTGSPCSDMMQTSVYDTHIMTAVWLHPLFCNQGDIFGIVLVLIPNRVKFI